MEVSLHTEFVRNRTVCRALGVGVFVVLTMLGAFVRIPIPWSPVPLTLQTFFVLLSGACLGRRLGAIAQACYLLIGIAGVPIFSQAGSGLMYLTGPTGGYLVGFIAATVWVGSACRRIKTRMGLCILFCAGSMIILCCGTVGLAVLLKSAPLKALYAGFLVFVPGDVVKAYAAASVYHIIGRRCRELF